jgi:hypothetical protein
VKRAFRFSFGRAPQPDDPALQELLEQARADAAKSPDGTGIATDSRSFRIELGSGKARVERVGHDAPSYDDPSGHVAEDPKTQREREMWERLHLIAQGKGAYPDTQRWHRRLSLITSIIAIAIPVSALILMLATGQTLETVAYVTIAATIVAMMFRGSIR